MDTMLKNLKFKIFIFLFTLNAHAIFIDYGFVKGGGAGTVTGPATSTLDDLVSFGDTSGQLLKDTGISSFNLVTSSSNFTAINHIVLTGGANKTLSQTGYTIPPVICAAGETLKSDGTNLTCQIDVAGTGDILGPASS